MKGQWSGKCEGTNTGTIYLNVDELSPHRFPSRPPEFEGVAHLIDDNKSLPGTAIFFKTAVKDNKFSFEARDIRPIDPKTKLISDWKFVKESYAPDVIVPAFVKVEGLLKNGTIEASWTSSIGTSGNSILQKTISTISSLKAKETKWDDFKKNLSDIIKSNDRPLFRGQRKKWRLRTSYHRSGRANLFRFMENDIKFLKRHLSGQTKHFFDLESPEQMGAFFNLLQHHGYPTPLLDWTYSPYVALFFAYRGISNEDAAKATDDDKVRILVFDQLKWQKHFPPESYSHSVLNTEPNLSVEEFMSIENPRMIPQQSVSTLTNIDDIEQFILSKETMNQTRYLYAIDLPVKERKSTMNELAYMGISAGSLFPGLEGACEEIRERNFDI